MAQLQDQCVIYCLKKHTISFEIFSDNDIEKNLDLTKLIKCMFRAKNIL